MKPRVLIFLMMFVVGATLIWNNLSYAGVDRIELTDGSVILGKIVSYGGGVFTIRSDTLGTITLGKDKIRDIRIEASGASSNHTAGQGGTLLKNRVKVLQESMAKNPDILESISSLQNDPDVQQVLKDPELMKAINSGDIQKLMSSHKFMKLLNKQEIKQISGELTP